MRYQDKTFRNEHVPLDGNEFVRCRFEQCLLVYGGGDPPTMRYCSFVDPALQFIGAARNTLGLLGMLYHGGFRDQVESTFDNIRANRDNPPPKAE